MTAVPTVYHHTSTLRTNLLWMSGVIELEGRGQAPLHPVLGEIRHGAPLRRSYRDFPPLAWFTTRVEVPNCLRQIEFYSESKTTGVRTPIATPSGVTPRMMADGLSLERVALGFPIAEIPVKPWPAHPGYNTDEGRELNESAHEVGDDPNDWYVAEAPIDILKISEFWAARSVLNPKLRKLDGYIDSVKRMVTLCKTTRAYIPPTWMNPNDVEKLVKQLGIPAIKP